MSKKCTDSRSLPSMSANLTPRDQSPTRNAPKATSRTLSVFERCLPRDMQVNGGECRAYSPHSKKTCLFGQQNAKPGPNPNTKSPESTAHRHEVYRITPVRLHLKPCMKLMPSLNVPWRQLDILRNIATFEVRLRCDCNATTMLTSWNCSKWS